MDRKAVLSERDRRVEIANKFIQIIASYGRRFFHYEGKVSRFVLNDLGRVYFIDKYTCAPIYTHQTGGWGVNFTEGGTLLFLCKALRDYIMERKDLPVSHLGPWPDWYCGGDLWGYGEDMTKVRQECLALKNLEAHHERQSITP